MRRSKIISALFAVRHNSVVRAVPNFVRFEKASATVPVRRRFSNDSKAKGYSDYLEAVKELSGDHFGCVSASTLLEWNESPLDTLTVEQLEDLGRAMHEGMEGITVNRERAFEIWTEGANRGSTEARYCRAACIREGTGTKKDPAAAFAEMIFLAEKENYNMAHVSLLLSCAK